MKVANECLGTSGHEKSEKRKIHAFSRGHHDISAGFGNINSLVLTNSLERKSCKC